MEDIFDRLIRREGGYVHDPLDPGGETKWGISKRCLHPTTKVLTMSLEWVPCEQLQVGDALLAFDEHTHIAGKGGRRYFRKAIIDDIGNITLPAYRVRTTKGDVIASGDHMWLLQNGNDNLYYWTKTTDLLGVLPNKRFKRANVERRLAWMHAPVEPLNTYAGGYLAGVLDSEGHYSGDSIGFTQKDNQLLKQSLQILDVLQIGYRITQSTSPGVLNVTLRKSIAHEELQLLSKLRPPRLLGKVTQHVLGKCISSKLSEQAIILGVDAIGEYKLIGLSTSTHTLIAEGFYTHNSYPHLDIKSLTKEDARAIYYRDYFVRYGINTLPECLQELMLDWAVHSGRVAVKTLQRLTGARDDGIIGVETLQRLTSVSLSSLKTQLVGERLRFYARLVQRNPSLTKYIVGWINRTLEFL